MRYHAGKPIESVVYCLNNQTAFVQARVLYGKLSKAYNTYCCDTLQKSQEYRSDDVIKMKFVKLWDLLRYSERTTPKTPTRQKLAIRAKLSLRC